MPHATAEARRRYNRKYSYHEPRYDYYVNLRSMGKPLQIVTLTANNGHVCEEIPICRQTAAYALVFRGETVNLCAEGYNRWREVLNL